jgi:TM2 domain-containing membrane protein YozV
MKSKITAGIFALLFGMLGLHRFYLGQRVRGILQFLFSLFCFAVSVTDNTPMILIPAAIAFIDAMLLLSMPQEDFDEKYNQRHFQRQSVGMKRPVEIRHTPPAQPAMSQAKASGIEKFRDYDFEGAIEDFKKALSEKYDDASVHFNLACCYSLLEKPDPAFFHLGKAVHFGFVDFEKIEKHDGLAYLRTLPEFDEFVKNGYQRSTRPAQDELSLSQDATGQVSLLDQIKKLGELRNKGILTEEEFVLQTKRVLGN